MQFSIDLNLKYENKMNRHKYNIRIHNPDSDSSHKTSESVDLTNLDSTDYGCEIRLIVGVFHNRNPSNLDSSDQRIRLFCDL